MLWCVAPALAGPAVQPEDLLLEHLASSGTIDVLEGSSDHSERAAAVLLSRVGDLESPWMAPLGEELAPWLDLGPPWPTWKARAWLRSGVGTLPPVGLSGDTEPGLFSQRIGAELLVQSELLELVLAPEVGFDLLGSRSAGLTGLEAWGAVHWRGLSLGFGARERALGPGEHSALVIGDGARPWPAGELAWEGRVPLLGRLRAETSIGWLPGERRDVQHPGLLHMDLRWSPVPMVELGASRLSLFGGEDRPLPPPGQLLLPTDPHVEGDPEGLLPDQDELAALDVRIAVPLARWLPGPVDALEGWYQYGGEDMIMRELGPLPAPALAGVANLFGVRVSGADWWVSAERAVLMDDLFRWYVGHRVYHEGFTRDGQSLGHVNGGDQSTWWVSVGWVRWPWGGELSFEQVRRVGAIEKAGSGPVFTLMTEEHRWKVGGLAWKGRPGGGHLGLGAEVQRTTGRGFVPGADDWTARLWVEWRTAARWAHTGPPWRGAAPPEKE